MGHLDVLRLRQGVPLGRLLTRSLVGLLEVDGFGLCSSVHCPAAGDGVVFSCKLLHEAMPVTKGRRFGLFAFFY